MLTIPPAIPSRARGPARAPPDALSAPRPAPPAAAGGRIPPAGNRTEPPRTWRTRPDTRSSGAPLPAIEQDLEERQVLRRPLLPDALDPEPGEYQRDREQRGEQRDQHRGRQPAAGIVEYH